MLLLLMLKDLCLCWRWCSLREVEVGAAAAGHRCGSGGDAAGLGVVAPERQCAAMLLLRS